MNSCVVENVAYFRLPHSIMYTHYYAVFISICIVYYRIPKPSLYVLPPIYTSTTSTKNMYISSYNVFYQIEAVRCSSYGKSTKHNRYTPIFIDRPSTVLLCVVKLNLHVFVCRRCAYGYYGYARMYTVYICVSVCACVLNDRVPTALSYQIVFYSFRNILLLLG